MVGTANDVKPARRRVVAIDGLQESDGGDLLEVFQWLRTSRETSREVPRQREILRDERLAIGHGSAGAISGGRRRDDITSLGSRSYDAAFTRRPRLRR